MPTNRSDAKSLFATAVKTWRGRLGISQEELAGRAGLHRTYVSDIERGARNLSLESIEKLAHALEIPRPFSLVEPMRNYMESKQGVRADFLDQNNQSSPKRSRGLNQLAAAQKIGTRLRKLEVKTDRFAALLIHRKSAPGGIVRHVVVDGGVIDRQPQFRMRGNVRNTLALEIHLPPVTKTFDISLSRSHRASK